MPCWSHRVGAIRVLPCEAGEVAPKGSEGAAHRAEQSSTPLNCRFRSRLRRARPGEPCGLPGASEPCGLLGGGQVCADRQTTNHLESLKLWNCNPGDEQAVILSRPFHLNTLRKLVLTENQIGPTGCAALLDAPMVAGLVNLDLSINRLGDAGAATVAASPRLGQLIELDICANRVSEAGGSCARRVAPPPSTPRTGGGRHHPGARGPSSADHVSRPSSKEGTVHRVNKVAPPVSSASSQTNTGSPQTTKGLL